MTSEAFDPIAVEQRLVAASMIPAAVPEDEPRGEPEGDAVYFTEGNPRLYALWRLSMARQFHPDVLAGMPEGDLLFLAGQTSKGYPDKGLGGIALEANKVDQNAARARAELANRAGKLGQRHTVLTTLFGAVVGAILALASAWMLGGDDDEDPPAATTTTIPPDVTTTTLPEATTPTETVAPP